MLFKDLAGDGWMCFAAYASHRPLSIPAGLREQPEGSGDARLKEIRRHIKAAAKQEGVTG